MRDFNWDDIHRREAVDIKEILAEATKLVAVVASAIIIGFLPFLIG